MNDGKPPHEMADGTDKGLREASTRLAVIGTTLAGVYTMAPVILCSATPPAARVAIHTGMLIVHWPWMWIAVGAAGVVYLYSLTKRVPRKVIGRAVHSAEEGKLEDTDWADLPAQVGVS